MMIHKCDICKKVIKGEAVRVGYERFSLLGSEICAKCGKPVLEFLNKHKLIGSKDFQEAMAVA